MATLHDIQYNIKILSPCSFLLLISLPYIPKIRLDFKVDVDHNCRHLHIQSSMRPEVTGQTCTSGTKIFFNIINTINFSGSTALTPEAQTLKRTFGQVSSRAPTGLVCRRGSSSPRRPSWSSHHWPPESLHGLSPWRSPCWSTTWPPEWPPSRVTKKRKVQNLGFRCWKLIQQLVTSQENIFSAVASHSLLDFCMEVTTSEVNVLEKRMDTTTR